MNGPEIRSLYVETLARVLKPITETGCCDECDHIPIVHGYLDAEELATALAEAGLLPTTALVETCVAGRDGECQCPTTVRYVTDPREVSE